MNKRRCFLSRYARTAQAGVRSFSTKWPYRALAGLAIIVLLTSCTLATRQGSGHVISETRVVQDFDQVEVCCGMKLMLTQGKESQLRLEADDNILPEIETLVRSGQLTVRFRSNFGPFNFRLSQPVTVYLQMPMIHGVTISGGGSLTTEAVETDHIALEFSGGSQGAIKNLQAQTIDLVTSGGGQTTIDTLEAETLALDVSGGGRVTFNGGTVTNQRVTTNGGSHYNAAAVEGETATLDVSGGSDVKIWVTEALHVEASGGSQVDYTGNPSLDQQLSGGSQVRAVKR